MSEVEAWCVKSSDGSLTPYYVQRTRKECIDSVVENCSSDTEKRTKSRSSIWRSLKSNFGISCVKVKISEVVE
jgi:hypothetical protein